MSRAAFRIGVVICLLWCSTWIFATRYAMLDDALIHLRYAANLSRLHFITYDGVHANFGTSSPAYVSLLAVIFSFWPTVMVPKIVSTVSYLLLLALILVVYRQARKNHLAAVLSLCLLGVVLSGTGVRWLTDGMETSLVCVSTVLLALLVNRILRGSSSPALSVGMFVYGMYLTVLRIELSALATLTALTIYFALVEGQRLKPAAALVRACPLFIGSLVGLLLVKAYFGSILPDTALAKAGSGPSLMILWVFVQVSGSAIVLGIGSLLLYVASAWLSARCGGKWGRTAWITANANLPLIILSACLRQQTLQGIRYFVWATIFSIVLNILTIADAKPQPNFWGSLSAKQRYSISGLALLFLIILPFDSYYAYRVMSGRARTFLHMRNESLWRLADQSLVAEDIGFIGYFSRANVCDLSGLINGREAAEKTFDERMLTCISQRPVALFVSEPLFAEITKYPSMPASDWVVCDKADFTNVRGNDRQLLFIRREDSVHFCPTLDKTIRSAQDDN